MIMIFRHGSRCDDDFPRMRTIMTTFAVEGPLGTLEGLVPGLVPGQGSWARSMGHAPGPSATGPGPQALSMGMAHGPWPPWGMISSYGRSGHDYFAENSCDNYFHNENSCDDYFQ